MNAKLIQYLEAGSLNKKDAIVALLFPRFIERKNAAFVFNRIRKQPIGFTPNKIIDIEPYRGKNNVIYKIRDFLKKNRHPSLHAVIVHGSVATDEIIPYSDFDGILLIEDQHINNPDDLLQLRDIIRQTEVMMRRQDGLQHHGWRVLLLSELYDYPEARIPSVLLEYGKVVYPDATLHFELLILKSQQDFIKPFNDLCKSILSKIESGQFEQSFYTFKNLVSEILLLPTLFMQALISQPVYKGDSFELIKGSLGDYPYTIIKEIELLRKDWDQQEVNIENEISAVRFRKFKPLYNFLRTPLPRRYIKWFTPERQNALISLINLMIKYLDKKQSGSYSLIK